ncbi:MAG TPA: RsmE family RNA methyltransferase [Candidatus Paceibacterota bacterium]
MRLHRFIGDFDFSASRIKISDFKLLHQLRSVLRFKTGDEIILSDGKSREARVKIIGQEKDFLEAEILELENNENEPERRAILYCALLKRENFELATQKAVEIGIKEIVPIIAQRTVKLNFNEERLKKIIKEAAEQSGRGIIPVLGRPIKFGEALDQAKKNSANLFFDATGDNFQTFKIESAGSVGIFIGPEGGWTEEELKAAKMENFSIVNLGKLTLRSETAAIIASYLVL